MKDHLETLALVGGLTHGQIGGDLPPALSERLTAPRYRARLERRFLRRTGMAGAPSSLFSGRVPSLVELGEAGLSALIVDVGVMCQYAILRRIVDRSTLADLSELLGTKLDGHDARRSTNGASMDLARAIASPGPSDMDATMVAEAVLRDGLRCWSCWIHGQPPALHGFLNALVPLLATNGTDDAKIGARVEADGETGEKCRPRDCRRRADLLVARLDLALAERDEPTRKDA